MVSGRTADLARCGVEGALEVDCLAYTLKLAQERGANMSCEVKAIEGLIAARQQNRCLLDPLAFYFVAVMSVVFTWAVLTRISTSLLC